MSDDIPFDKSFDLAPDIVDQVAPGVRRVLANNPSPFTFKGTLSYIVGRGHVAIIDPGPLDEAHIAALLDAVRGETVTHIFVTHTHRDHSPAVPANQGGDRGRGAGRRAASRRAAAQYRRGAAPRRQQRYRVPARPRAGRRRGRRPARGWTIEAVTTPGHTANHMAFALKEGEPAVLRRSCDGVVDADRRAAGWRDERLHGLAAEARARARSRSICPAMAARCARRRASCSLHPASPGREASILHRLGKGEADIPTLVRAIYIGLDPRLVEGGRTLGAGASGRSGQPRGAGRDRRPAFDRAALIALACRVACRFGLIFLAGVFLRRRLRRRRSGLGCGSRRRSRSSSSRMRAALVPKSCGRSARTSARRCASRRSRPARAPTRRRGSP